MRKLFFLTFSFVALLFLIAESTGDAACGRGRGGRFFGNGRIKRVVGRIIHPFHHQASMGGASQSGGWVNDGANNDQTVPAESVPPNFISADLADDDFHVNAPETLPPLEENAKPIKEKYKQYSPTTEGDRMVMVLQPRIVRQRFVRWGGRTVTRTITNGHVVTMVPESQVQPGVLTVKDRAVYMQGGCVGGR